MTLTLDRLLVAAAVLGVVAFTAEVLPPFSSLPESDMNASRLTPAVALAHGQAIYAGPDHGAVIDFMYGPMAAIAFVPSALASSPSGALLIAGALNLLAFFVPMAWLHARLPPRVAVASFLCFALLVSYDLGLSFSAFTIHADAPALALCAAACVSYLRGGRAAAALAAAWAVLAVWTKQPAAPIVLALPLHALVTGGVRHGARHALWLIGIGVVVSFGFLLLFGYRDVVFNMFTLPGRMPWYGEPEHGKAPAALRSLGLLARQNRWPVAFLALLTLASARGAGGMRSWLGAHPWSLLALVGALMVPTAVVGGAKVGGFLNTHSFTNYFVLGAATLGLGEAAAGAGSLARRPAAALLLVLLLALATSSLASRRQHRAVGAALARLRAWRANPQQQAYDFARAHPGEVWFPWNPLACLQADGRLDHSEIGIWNRELAGMDMSAAHLRAHLPPAMRWLAFRPPAGAFTWLPPANHHLPDFREPVAMPGLEGWVVYRRAGS